jgi:resuscitation-promoting factor RpfB
VVRPTRLRRLRIQRALRVGVMSTGVVLVAATVSLAWHKHVTLVVAGTPASVSTTSSNVGDLLRSEGLPLSLGLQVQPPPVTALADGMTVMVSQPPGMPADAFSATVGPHGVGVWVVERPREGLFGKAVPLSGQAAALGAVGPSTLSVRAVVSGKVHDVSTNANTVGVLLSAMGIEPDADDRVVPPPSTPLLSGITVRYDRVEVTDVRQFHVLPYGVHTEYTSRMVPGTSAVLHQGVPGVVDQTLRLTLLNGRVEQRELLSRTVYLRPQSEERLSAPWSMYDGTLTEPGTGATSEEGQATWYDPPWTGLTAAHPWLPFGTHVTVTDLATGRSVTVVIDDRGPFSPGRVIDLSPEAFSVLSPLGHGVLHVSLSW